MRFSVESRNIIQNVPDPKDAIIAALGASAALAGLLLVFIGFVYAHGETYETVRGDPFRIAAKFGVLPFLITVSCVWFCFEWLTGSKWAYDWSVWMFRVGVICTALYGAVMMLFYL